MVLTAVLQISTVLVAVLTLVWHQTRTVDRLRDEVRRDHGHLLKLQAKATRQARKDNNRLREEVNAAIQGLREEFNAAIQGLREEFNAASQGLREEFNAASQGLREEFNAASQGLREEFNAASQGLRDEFTTANGTLWDTYGKLWDAVIANSRKLDRIEGFLGIGMPEPAADQAPGAAFGASGDQPEDGFAHQPDEAGSDEDD